MNWMPIDTPDDLKRLDEAVCWEDSKTLEYYATFKNEDFFPSDVNRSGHDNKNIHVLCRVSSPLGRYLEMVLIDCDRYGSRFLDEPFMAGHVDCLKRVEIENEKHATVMRCSRLIYRFLSDDRVVEGCYYRPNTQAEPHASAHG